MTERIVRPVPGAPSVELARRAPSELDDIARLGQWLAWSEADGQPTPAQERGAALRLYYARELGLMPHAAAELSVISGKLVVGAALLRALARKAGYIVERVELTDTSCTTRISAHAGLVLGCSTFTLDDARAAGLIRDKSAWKSHPKRMLWARSSKNAIVDFAPEVALGIVLDDELQELAPAAPAGYLDGEPYNPNPPDDDDDLDDDDANVDVDDIEF